MKFWLHQVLVAIDQLINALAGGWADETVSSRAYRLKRHFPFCVYRWLIDQVMFFDPDHCRMSFENERMRLQLPPELRMK